MELVEIGRIDDDLADQYMIPLKRVLITNGYYLFEDYIFTRKEHNEVE